jgi:hypothetical protein
VNKVELAGKPFIGAPECDVVHRGYDKLGNLFYFILKVQGEDLPEYVPCEARGEGADLVEKIIKEASDASFGEGRNDGIKIKGSIHSFEIRNSARGGCRMIVRCETVKRSDA